MTVTTRPIPSDANLVASFADVIVGDADRLSAEQIDVIREINERVRLLPSIDVFDDGGFVLMYAPTFNEFSEHSFMVDFANDGKVFGATRGPKFEPDDYSHPVVAELVEKYGLAPTEGAAD